jgi:glycerate-2-kinase
VKENAIVVVIAADQATQLLEPLEYVRLLLKMLMEQYTALIEIMNTIRKHVSSGQHPLKI